MKGRYTEEQLREIMEIKEQYELVNQETIDVEHPLLKASELIVKERGKKRNKNDSQKKQKAK